MQEQLNLSFIDMATADQDAGMLIRLSNVEQEEQLLTASAVGNPLERELYLKATVDWLSADGKEIIESERFNLRQDFVYDDEAVLAKAREADFLMQELERELARRIVARLRNLQ